jgi:hypothetical protein
MGHLSVVFDSLIVVVIFLTPRTPDHSSPEFHGILGRNFAFFDLSCFLCWLHFIISQFPINFRCEHCSFPNNPVKFVAGDTVYTSWCNISVSDLKISL